MQPYPRALDLVWPGHLHGTGCFSVWAVDTGFPTVVWQACLVFGHDLPWLLLALVSDLIRGRVWVCPCLLPSLAVACGVCGWMSGASPLRLFRLGFGARVSARGLRSWWWVCAGNVGCGGHSTREVSQGRMDDAEDKKAIFPVATKGPAAAQWRGQAVHILLPDGRVGDRGTVEVEVRQGKGQDTSTMCLCLT